MDRAPPTSAPSPGWPGAAIPAAGSFVAAEPPAITRKLSRTVGKTLADYALIRPGDHVMVCLSGGKDSYTLLDLLWEARRRVPFRFELTAVHLDQVQPGYDGRPLVRWLERFGAPFEIVREDTYSTVLAHTRPGKTYCSMCSRLRRGILYRTAAQLGADVIALGHHRDDALETLLLNLFYAGKLQAMPAGYTTDDGRFRVIRPLIECAEADIRAHATLAGYPILPCNLCGSQEGLRREAMTALLDQLEADNPNVRATMLAALKAVHPSHLLDREVAEVWLAREAAPGPATAPGAARGPVDAWLQPPAPAAEAGREPLGPADRSPLIALRLGR